MKNERQQGNWGIRIEIAGKGRITHKRGGVEIILDENAAPRIKGGEKEIPTDDIETLQSLVNQAFPEQGLGMGQAEYFIPMEEGSQDEIVSACARLAGKGWSSKRVAVHIVNDNIRVRVGLSLGGVKKENISDDINRFANYLARFYPGNQTRKRR